MNEYHPPFISKLIFAVVTTATSLGASAQTSSPQEPIQPNNGSTVAQPGPETNTELFRRFAHSVGGSEIGLLARLAGDSEAKYLEWFPAFPPKHFDTLPTEFTLRVIPFSLSANGWADDLTAAVNTINDFCKNSGGSLNFIERWNGRWGVPKSNSSLPDGADFMASFGRKNFGRYICNVSNQDGYGYDLRAVKVDTLAIRAFPLKPYLHAMAQTAGDDRAATERAKAAAVAIDQQLSTLRENLKPGDNVSYQGNCGMIVEAKPPIAQVQTSTGIRWVKISELNLCSTLWAR